MSRKFAEHSVEEFELMVHDLIEDGNEVIRITAYHYQINKDIHVFPLTNRFTYKHKKGIYKDIYQLINKVKAWQLKS